MNERRAAFAKLASYLDAFVQDWREELTPEENDAMVELLGLVLGWCQVLYERVFVRGFTDSCV